ncbi:MAG: hypothetical protein ABIP17_02200 [Ilumatobacteraceae bacterium]
MPYTLMKGLIWVLLAVVLGVVIGWLLRSVAAKRQIERARSGNVGSTDQAEVERLRNRVANLETVVTERDRLRKELDERSSVTGAVPATVPESIIGAPPAADPPALAADTELAEAAAVLGRPVILDDLTVIEGIGPTTAELCHGIGITTWAELSVTEVSLLRTMLNDAGQRFKATDPSTWPTQAALLAGSAWADFKAFVDGIDGDRADD